MTDYTLNSRTDADGSEVLTGITFTSVIEPAVERIYRNYKHGIWMSEAKLEVCRQIAGRQTVVSSVDMERIRVDDFDLVLLDKDTVAETVTLTAESVTVTNFDTVLTASALGPGSIALICVGAAAVIGVGTFLVVRRKKKVDSTDSERF